MNNSQTAIIPEAASRSGATTGRILPLRRHGSVTLGDFSDTVSLAGTLNGSVTMNDGNGNNTLGFNHMGTVDASKHLNFENLEIYGGSTTLTGTRIYGRLKTPQPKSFDPLPQQRR